MRSAFERFTDWALSYAILQRSQNAHGDQNEAKHALVDMSTIQLRAEDLVSLVFPHHARWRSFSTCPPQPIPPGSRQWSNVAKTGH